MNLLKGTKLWRRGFRMAIYATAVVVLVKLFTFEGDKRIFLVLPN
jgi:hypothetical protein